MQFRRSVVALGLMLGAGWAGATVTVNTGAYSLTYDETTLGFGALASWSSGPGGAVSFEWSINPVVQVVSTGGASVTRTFQIPDFTITANPGYVLSGAVTRHLGNLTFSELGVGATTSVGANGSVTVDGGAAPPPPPFLLPQQLSLNSPALRLGYFNGDLTVPFGSFHTLQVSGASLVLSASGGLNAAINTQPQNVLEVSFFAQAVPEPGTYAMFLAGFGVIGWLARRRQR